MRPSTLEHLAAEAGVPAPAVTASSGFAEFIALYAAACAVLTTQDAVFRLCREVAEDAAAAGMTSRSRRNEPASAPEELPPY